jgi:hypothetical protein
MVPDWISNAFTPPVTLPEPVTYIFFDQHGVAQSADSIKKVLKAKRLRDLNLTDVIKFGSGFVVLTLMVLAIYNQLTTPF